MDTTNVSKENLRTKQPVSRVVQSKYKTGAISKDNSGSNSSNSSKANNKSSNESNSSSSACKKQTQKAKPSRVSQASKPKASGVIGGSSSNLAKVSGITSQVSAWRRGSSVQSLIIHPELQSSGTESQKFKSSSVQGNRAKLHSTILNATLQGDVTNFKTPNNVFSSTMVGGLAPGGRKLDMTGAALPELPDISAIKLDSISSGSRSGDTTILSSVTEKDTTQDSDNSSVNEVTSEDLEQEYLSYLQWAYINQKSEDAFSTQLKEMQNQLSFLEQLVSEKQFEVSEIKQMTKIIHHHQRVHEALKLKKNLLQALVDGLPACEEAVRLMSQELEKCLHQVKMNTLYVPENHQIYRDQLSEVLHNQISLLSDLESLMKPQSHQLNSIISLLGEVQNVALGTQQSENEVQLAARLAVQEASLHIGARQMKILGWNGPPEDSALEILN